MTRNKKTIIFALLAALLSFHGTVHGADARGLVEKGNKLYEDGKLDEALDMYRKALEKDPGDPTALYNKAVVLYRKGEYASSEQAFLKSMAAAENSLEEKSSYNVGNAKFREAEKAGQKGASSALRPYEQALEYYKRAMEMSPEDMDAKHNYEYTLKKLKQAKQQRQQQQDQQQQQQDQKQQQQQRQQQQQQQDQKQQQQQQDQKQQQQQDQKDRQEQKKEQEQEQKDQRDQQDQQQQQQQQQDQKDRQEQKKEQEQEQKDQRDRQDQQQDQQQQQQDRKDRKDEDREERPDGREAPGGGTPRQEIRPEPDRMSREQAEMLLESQEEEERRMRAEKKKARAGQRPPVVRDW